MTDSGLHITFSEKGFIMPYAVLALAVLTILGIMVAQNSSTESLIAGNIKAMKMNFYSAEGAAIKAARAIENENSANLKDMKLQLPDDSEVAINAGTVSRKAFAAALKNGSIPNTTGDPHSGFDVVARGAAEGESLDIGVAERITYKYNIFGVSNAGGVGRKVIEIGYIRTISLTE